MTKSLFNLTVVFSILIVLNSCDNEENLYPPGYEEPELPSDTAAYTMYLIGDAGIAKSSPLEPSLELLQKKLEQADSDKSAVVFLGDNIYPNGLHAEGHEMRKQDESYIDAQLSIVENYDGRVVFIPGNHDWNKGSEGGDVFIDRQAKYVKRMLDNSDAFLPKAGCPGPIEIQLSKDLTWIILDTQWWFQFHSAENSVSSDCPISEKDIFLEALEKVVERNSDKQIIISGHHPLYSNGTHGGYFPFRDHIFPLTHVNEYLYIPLPVLGSVYPLYRGLHGNVQDLTHERYSKLIEGLTTIFREYPDLIYTSGHEHSLQYQKHDAVHYIVSGSGSKRSFLWNNDDLIYGRASKGFAVLKKYPSGEVWLEFYTPSAEDPINPTYRAMIVKGSSEDRPAA